MIIHKPNTKIATAADVDSEGRFMLWHEGCQQWVVSMLQWHHSIYSEPGPIDGYWYDPKKPLLEIIAARAWFRIERRWKLIREGFHQIFNFRP